MQCTIYIERCELCSVHTVSFTVGSVQKTPIVNPIDWLLIRIADLQYIYCELQPKSYSDLKVMAVQLNI